MTDARAGITLDTGALIALERRTRRMWTVYRAALEDRLTVTVPAAALVEWWRGRSDVRDRILAGVRVEALSTKLACLAGEALAAVSASPVDAMVMASAALRGDVVYTSDVGDLEALRRYFPAVRVLSV